MDTVHSAITEPVRRFEVFTGAGRRRKWSDEDKARIVAESVASGESVCAVARRHGLSPQQLFGWRRQAAGSCGREHSKRKNRCSCRRWWKRRCPSAPILGGSATAASSRSPIAGMIEVEIDGVAMRVGRGADAKTVAAVIRALKASA